MDALNRAFVILFGVVGVAYLIGLSALSGVLIAVWVLCLFMPGGRNLTIGGYMPAIVLTGVTLPVEIGMFDHVMSELVLAVAHIANVAMGLLVYMATALKSRMLEIEAAAAQPDSPPLASEHKRRPPSMVWETVRRLGPPMVLLACSAGILTELLQAPPPEPDELAQPIYRLMKLPAAIGTGIGLVWLLMAVWSWRIDMRFALLIAGYQQEGALQGIVPKEGDDEDK